MWRKFHFSCRFSHTKENSNNNYDNDNSPRANRPVSLFKWLWEICPLQCPGIIRYKPIASPPKRRSMLSSANFPFAPSQPYCNKLRPTSVPISKLKEKLQSTTTTFTQTPPWNQLAKILSTTFACPGSINLRAAGTWTYNQQPLPTADWLPPLARALVFGKKFVPDIGGGHTSSPA